MDKLNHYSLTNPASVYDEEALTALELAGRTAAKVNEAVDNFNELERETNQSIADHRKQTTETLENFHNEAVGAFNHQVTTVIPDTVEMVVGRHITEGQFDEAVSKHLDDLNERVDTLLGSVVEGSTSGDAELVDIRTGAYQDTYPNAGEAVRGQIKSTVELLNNGFELKFTSGNIAKNGVIVASDNNNYYSQIIPSYLLKQGMGSIVVNIKNQKAIVAMCKYLNGVFVSREGFYNYGDNPVMNVDDVAYDYRLLIATNPDYVSGEMTAAEVLANITIDILWNTANIAEVSKQLAEVEENLIRHTTLEWTKGNIDTNSGMVIEGDVVTYNNHYSQIIPSARVKSVTLSPRGNCQVCLAYYNRGTYMEKTEWVKPQSTQRFITGGYDVRVIIANTQEGTTETPEQLAASAGITIDWGFLSLEDTNKRIDELAKTHDNKDFIGHLLSCDFEGKIIHYSVDDVIKIIYNLVHTNYESVWEEPYLAQLKEMHNANGLCFTLNCFLWGYGDSNDLNTQVHINELPANDVWRAEFQEAKSWLRFAFHAVNADSRNTTDEGYNFAEQYNTFVEAIYTLTGDYGCIDRITRLGWYSGDRATLQTLRDCDHGCIGFLTADDDRLSYYFDEEENRHAIEKGKYFDIGERLVFFKSQPRLDSNGADQVWAMVQANPMQQKVVELFCHEPFLANNPNGRLGTIGYKANQAGYVHGFPMDYYK